MKADASLSHTELWIYVFTWMQLTRSLLLLHLEKATLRLHGIVLNMKNVAVNTEKKLFTLGDGIDRQLM